MIANFDLRVCTLKQIQNGQCHHQFFINKRPTLILGENLCPGAFAKRPWQFGSGGEGQPIATQLKNKRLACEARDLKQHFNSLNYAHYVKRYTFYSIFTEKKVVDRDKF